MVLAVVIVNFRTSEYTIACLQSLFGERKEFAEFEVFLVENGSEDGSLGSLTDAIRENGWEGWVNFLPQSENLGYALVILIYHLLMLIELMALQSFQLLL